MAKVTFGGGVSNIQGSVAGNTFTRTRAGVAIRNKVKPNNPASAAQMRQREALTRLSKQWKTLTEEERLAWDSFAKLSQTRGVCGNIIAATGHQGFMKMNMNRFNMLEEPLTTPDDVQNAAFISDMWGDQQAFVVTTAPIDFTIPLGPGATEGMNYQAWLSGPKSPGKNLNFKQLKLTTIGPLDAAEIAQGFIEFGTDTFYEMFGTIVGTSGKKWTAGLRQYSKSIFAVPTMMTTIVDGSDP